MAPDVPAENASTVLLADNVNRAQGITHHHDGQNSQREGNLVADRLGCRTQSTQQRVLVVGGITSHQQTDGLDAAQGDPEKDAHTHIADQQVLTEGNDQPGQDHRNHDQHGTEGEQQPIGPGRNDVLLHQQLEAVRQRLKHTQSPCIFGTDALLNGCRNLAFQPHRHQHTDDSGDQDQQHRQRQPEQTCRLCGQSKSL